MHLKREFKMEDLETHYLVYIILHADSLKQDATRKKYNYLKAYADLEMAKRESRKKLGGWYIGFVVREVSFDSNGHTVVDKEIYSENL